MVKQILADTDAAKALSRSGLTGYGEAMQRVLGFKQYIEHNDGYKLVNKTEGGKPFSREADLQLFFGLNFLALSSISIVSRIMGVAPSTSR